MKRIVLKFGGTSLSDTTRIRAAAEIVARVAAGGHQVALVVSAMGHTTDQLLGLAEDISQSPCEREIDSLLVTGEMVSAALMTIALQALGLKAQSFTGDSAGIITERCFGNARIEKINGDAVERCLNEGVIPVVAGFQGVTSDGEVTTLGRGGSDTTAIALAAYLRAERCDIYSDVNGVYSADPHLIEDAFRLPVISYEDMLELSLNGAQVLNPRSVEIASKAGMPVRVRSTFQPGDEGSLITHVTDRTDSFISLACRDGRICVQIMPGNVAFIDRNKDLREVQPGWRKKVVASLCDAGISAELGAYPNAHDEYLAFSIPKSDGERMKVALDEVKKDLEHCQIRSEPGVVGISLVGAIWHPHIQTIAVNALASAAIPIELVLRARRRLSFFVPENSWGQALRLLHASLCPNSAVA